MNSSWLQVIKVKGVGGGVDLVVSVFSRELDLCMKERMQVCDLKVRSVTF